MDGGPIPRSRRAGRETSCLSPPSGRAYLQARHTAIRRRQEDAEARTARAREIHDALSARAAESTLVPTRKEGRRATPLLHGAYLVAHRRSEVFRSMAREMAERSRTLRLELTGPSPPYHFVRAELSGTIGHREGL